MERTYPNAVSLIAFPPVDSDRQIPQIAMSFIRHTSCVRTSSCVAPIQLAARVPMEQQPLQ